MASGAGRSQNLSYLRHIGWCRIYVYPKFPYTRATTRTAVNRLRFTSTVKSPQQPRHISPLVFGSSRLTLTRASRTLRAKKRDTVAGTGGVGYRPQHGRGDRRGATAAERVLKAHQVGEAVDLRILAPLRSENESHRGRRVCAISFCPRGGHELLFTPAQAFMQVTTIVSGVAAKRLAVIPVAHTGAAHDSAGQ